MGVLPVAADPHSEHYIRFTGETDGKISLLDATVGTEYSYALPIETCGELENFSVTSVSGDLPTGLNLTPAGGISGIPAAGTKGEYEFTIKATGTCPEQPDTAVEATVTCTLTVRPRMITWRIPYTKRVVQGGTSSPGPETFTFEIFDVGITSLADQVTISTGDSISTNGPRDYESHLSVTGPEDALAEGIAISEVNGGAPHWTYSDAVYYITPGVDIALREGGDDFEIHMGDEFGTECERMTFTNTYTYSPSRDDDRDDDYDYDYDDEDDYDDDDDRPIREPEADEKPRSRVARQQPQEDAVKSNPQTGRGTVWDRLVYLYHNLFSWAA